MKLSLIHNFFTFVRLIFKKVGESMGGRLRLLLTGGAPLSPETQEYTKLTLCAVVIQGYALTETTSGGTVVDSKHEQFNQYVIC